MCIGGINILQNNFVGAHIEEAKNPTKQYIYPLCNICNSKYGEEKATSPVFLVKKDYCATFSLHESLVERLDE